MLLSFPYAFLIFFFQSHASPFSSTYFYFSLLAFCAAALFISSIFVVSLLFEA